MSNFYDDNADLRWYVDTGLDWEPIVRLTEYDYRSDDGFKSVPEALEVYRDMLDLVGTYCAEAIAPRWSELDDAHPHVEDGEVIEAQVTREIFAGIADMGLHGLCIPRELGGMNAPLLLLQMNSEMFARADVSTCTHVGFHGGMALAALMYSVLEGTTAFQTDPPEITETRFRQCIEEIVAGEAWGSMDITEPGAGSDMAAMRCRGVQDADGNWTVSGQKIFITSGHGKWHFVIARTEETDAADAFAGLKGLSMFLVAAYEEVDGDKKWLASIDGTEIKLGHNASATVSISFEDTPAELIGERGEGFKYMLLLMNNARVGVGFEALGAMENSYRAAAAYAAERPSMGKTIDKHEMIADLLEEMRTDIQATRAVAMEAAWNEELNQKARIALGHLELSDDARAELERDQKKWAARSRQLTPLLKWFAGEKAVEVGRRSIQIHGGSGYIREYQVEKVFRDAMVFPIYEGTSQIQALMVMKDTLLGAVKNPKRFVADTAAARWRSMRARDPMERRVATLRLRAQQTIQFLVSRLAATKIRDLPNHGVSSWSGVMKQWDPKQDFALAMLHAERLTSILNDAVVAEILWEQQVKDAGRREILACWLERAEPRTRYMHDVITTTGLRLLRSLQEPTPAQNAAK
jgi:alkylation response protein AidB-like acyl-CoA dehydrogenase